jgi:chemotaxis protein CheX
MDHAVEDVFQSMLERSCQPVVRSIAQITAEPFGIPANVTACISFSGSLEAQCVVEFPSPSAQQLTGALLGPGPEAWDAIMVGDAVGELCNMIAGGWKKRMGAEANLSVPTICWAPATCTRPSCGSCMRRVYAFDNSAFVVILAT